MKRKAVKSAHKMIGSLTRKRGTEEIILLGALNRSTKVLNDLMGKNPGVTEMNDILTPTNITLNDTEDISRRLVQPLLQLFNLRCPNEAEVHRLVPESLIN